MNTWKRLLLGSDRSIGQRNMIWNMVGSAVYSLTSMMLGIAVTRIVGPDLGGIFLFAFTTFGQQMFTLSYFGMRPIQITDVQDEYSFGDYRYFRIWTSLAAILTGLFYMILFVDGTVKKAVVMLMVCYKVVDGFADVYESEFQRNGKLYLTGKSNTFRTLLSVGCFLLVILVTKNLILACVVAVFAQILGFLLFNQLLIGELPGIDWSVHKGSWKGLWQSSKWLFLSTFLDLYIFSAAKYAIDAHMEPSASAYFGTVFIPTSIINLAAGFVIRPFLTTMSDYWEKQEYQAFWGSVRKIILAIAGFTVVGLAAAYVLGIPVLSLLLGSEAGTGLLSCKMALLINITGGSFYAIANLFYYVQVIMKDQRSIFMIYGIGCIVAAWLSPQMVKAWGIDGGAFSYLFLMILLTGMFLVSVMRNQRKVRKTM